MSPHRTHHVKHPFIEINISHKLFNLTKFSQSDWSVGKSDYVTSHNLDVRDNQSMYHWNHNDQIYRSPIAEQIGILEPSALPSFQYQCGYHTLLSLLTRSHMVSRCSQTLRGVLKNRRRLLQPVGLLTGSWEIQALWFTGREREGWGKSIHSFSLTLAADSLEVKPWGMCLIISDY